MKKTIAIIFLLLNSCINSKDLINQKFMTLDTIKENSFYFINDSICFYKQKFFCDLPEPYKEINTICKYEVKKNKIILKNLTKNKDSIGVSCIKIPDSIFYKYFNNCNHKKKDTIVYFGYNNKISDYDVYGFINIINNDTLQYRNKKILYKKIIKFDNRLMYFKMVFVKE
jgi:hypothetical protein